MIDEILCMLQPPQTPVGVGTPKDEALVEQILGTRLPSDYWDYALRFGSGKVVYSSEIPEPCGIDLVVYNPFASSYLPCVESDCDTLRQLKQSCYDEIPFDVFPSLPGLLSWGSSVNGDTFCWLTKGDIDRWPVVMLPEGGGVEVFHLTMTTFIGALLSRRIVPKVWEGLGFFSQSAAISFFPGY